MARILGEAGVVVAAARGASLLAGILSSVLITMRPAGNAASAQSGSPPPPIYTQDPQAARTGGSAAAFLKRLRETGSLSVIVGLRMSVRPEDTLSEPDLHAQREALRTMQDG